ncbi:cyclin-domain-containing protein [Mycena capillaripes]|nr:cyclin-domain-containing protein [Mycena capillaripes]
MELPVASNATVTAAMAAQSGGSHLFQNAAGFDIVGGQFVLGDVHNHPPAPGPQSSTLLPLLNTLDETFSESEIYCLHMLYQKRGLPLYVPEPKINLSAQYRKHGVAIGDVGRVTPEGIFDFFFNIFLPPQHPINADHTPEDFSPMLPYDPIDLLHENYDAGDYLSSSTVQKLDLDAPSDEFPGGDFVFQCDGLQGAVLALPNGAQLQKLENVENMRAYAAEHADSWYRYINGARGRGLANGDLYLVTGCEKARSWGIASFRTAREEFQLFFKPTTKAGTAHKAYRWSGPHGQRNPARRKSHDPPCSNDPVNQTTFIHGLSITLGTGLWSRLLGTVTVETSSIADFHLRSIRTGDLNSSSSQGSSFSWSWIFSGSSTTGGNRHAGETEAVELSDLSLTAKVFNPAKLINEYILQKAPQATVVISHVNDWRDIWEDEPNARNPSVFFQRIEDQFTITEKDGATFLVSKSEQTQSSPADFPPPTTSKICLPGTNLNNGDLIFNSETGTSSPVVGQQYNKPSPVDSGSTSHDPRPNPKDTHAFELAREAVQLDSNNKEPQAIFIDDSLPSNESMEQLPEDFSFVPIDSLVLLIADMLERLIAHNDGIPLLPESLTRFHSRSAPAITVVDYLRRIVRFTNVEKSCLLITLHYIDQICARMPLFVLSSLTCHRFMIASITVASKGLCNTFHSDNLYARVGGISVTELNILEREFREKIGGQLTCTREVLQKYYLNLVRFHSAGGAPSSGGSIFSDSDVKVATLRSRPSTTVHTILIESTRLTTDVIRRPTIEQKMAFAALQQSHWPRIGPIGRGGNLEFSTSS